MSLILFSEILPSNDLYSWHLFMVCPKRQITMGSKRKKDGDTLAVTQLIFVDLGMQVGKNDIILLMTLNCLKFTKNKTKKKWRSDNSSTSIFIIGHKIFVIRFTCNHDSPVSLHFYLKFFYRSLLTSTAVFNQRITSFSLHFRKLTRWHKGSI